MSTEVVDSCLTCSEPSAPAAAVCELEEVLREVQSFIPPLWPLKDYVAVNPFLGMTHHSFLEARRMLREVRNTDLLMPLEHFRRAVNSGQIGRKDVLQALEECRESTPGPFQNWTVDEILERASTENLPHSSKSSSRAVWTVSEQVDLDEGTEWSTVILNEVSRHCAAHYDEGQSSWRNPWRGLSLYEAWCRRSVIDRRLEMLGAPAFRQFVDQLPDQPVDAVRFLLDLLNVPESRWKPFLLCQLHSIGGWASWVQYQARQSQQAGQPNSDLVGLLAIRLAFDAAVQQTAQVEWRTCPVETDIDADRIETDLVPRYVLQVAGEVAFRRRLLAGINLQRPAADAPLSRQAAQLVFCIDVRSEPLRRHLEAVDPGIGTFGFAGFFGLPLKYIPLGEDQGTVQCPALIEPQFAVHETVRTADASERTRTLAGRAFVRSLRKLWKSFQTSAASCFSFVESIGLLYGGLMLGRTLSLRAVARSARFDGVPRRDRDTLGPSLANLDALSSAERTDLAAGILHGLGLKSGFARLVVLCGHAAETVNNPLRAGLDCGACCGHSGEPNARLAAALLNDGNVQAGLKKRGIEIPPDVWFLPAIHQTTTDTIQFCDVDLLPPSHMDDLQKLEQWVSEAASRARAERADGMNTTPGDLFRRSRDWSEVRPEWGLAGNAAFVIAPRTRTEGVDLGGRVFLHGYNHDLDPDHKVLELLLTAPMVVASWINLQYYASTVDNRSFGSGNKVIHNVTGRFGVLQGNGGDLMTGLPWQSLHDGQQYRHEPLRMQVIVEAPRTAIDPILQQHADVDQLTRNGWLTLLALDSDRFYRRTSAGDWVAQ